MRLNFFCFIAAYSEFFLIGGGASFSLLAVAEVIFKSL
jgi:hypothetical protein